MGRSQACTFERSLQHLSRWMVYAGGALLGLLSILIVISVSGRYLLSLPIEGDFELVEVGTAMVVALFLPYTQLHRGHVIVDFCTSKIKTRYKKKLDAVAHFLCALIFIIIFWRTCIGMYGFARYGDESMVLQIPTYWSFFVIGPSLALVIVCGLWTALSCWRESL